VTRALPVLAVDIGGTKIAVALVTASGRVQHAVRLPTPKAREGDAGPVMAAVLEAAHAVAGHAEDGLAGVGVGCGGPMVWPAGDVSPLNLPGLRGYPLRARFRAEFPGTTVRVHNDAVCAAAGEHWRGSGRGKRNMLGMVVSTGVGGGLVVDDRLVDGAHGNAGHIGHVVVEPDGPACACGGRGCLEAVASGPHLAAWARQQGWREGMAPGATTAADLADDARRGHAVALAALHRAGTALGVAIASVTALLDLELVAIGGGLAQAGPLLFEPLTDAYRRHARMPFMADVVVVPARLGQDAGLVGAAALVCAGDRYWAGGE